MNKFKDSCNRWLTSGLFYELRDQNLEFALFTVRDEDREVEGKKLISLKKCFLSCSDPLEYEFANKFLGGWEHWKAIQASPVVLPHIEAWREEWEIKARSEALERIIELSKTDKGYQAAKFLADRGWVIRPAGAPSKDEKEGFKKQSQRIDDIISKDAERLGLFKVVK